MQQPPPQEDEINDSESPGEPAASEPPQVAQLADLGQDSAGGDEPPSLSGSLQSLSSYPTPAATELAEELIEPAPDFLEEAELIAEVAPAEGSNEPEVVAASVVEGELVEPGPTVNPPVMLTRPEPKYPQSALRLKRESEVTVRVLVDETGRVSRAERSGPKAGLGFDQAAIASAKQTFWQPATKEGVRVSMWVELKIHFRP